MCAYTALAHMCASMWAWACARGSVCLCGCVFGARAHARRACIEHASTVRALSVGVDRVWFGSQAFKSASAFNANIGVWNTGRVSTLSGVCAVFGRRGDADAFGFC